MKKLFRGILREEDRQNDQFKLARIKISRNRYRGANEDTMRHALRSFTLRIPEEVSVDGDRGSLRTLLREGKELRRDFALNDRQLLSLLIARSTGELAKRLAKEHARHTPIDHIYHDLQLDAEGPDQLTVERKVADFKHIKDGIRPFLKDLSALIRDASEFRHPRDQEKYESDTFRSKLLMVLPECVTRKLMTRCDNTSSMVELKQKVLKFEKEIDKELTKDETSGMQSWKEEKQKEVMSNEADKETDRLRNEVRRLREALGLFQMELPPPTG